MHILVRKLYKEILYIGRNHPQGLDYIRKKAKEEFFKNKNLTNEREINKAIGYGRWMIREMIGIIKTKKYRYLNKKYGKIDKN